MTGDCSRFMWTMSEYKSMICITNRHLCGEDFLQRIHSLAGIPEIERIILREKDMAQEDYESLAEQCRDICRHAGKPFAVNHFIQAARRLKIPDIQIAFAQMEKNREYLGEFSSVGVSVHSSEEARQAEALGASYIIAGHIYATNCKEGIPPRGLRYLKEVCDSTGLPVYAIGGITPHNMAEVLAAGAAGGCMMSGFMKY